MQKTSNTKGFDAGIRSSLPEIWTLEAVRIGREAVNDEHTLNELKQLFNEQGQSRKGLAALASYLCHGGTDAHLLSLHTDIIVPKLRALTQIFVATN